MKKITSLILALIMLLGLASCNTAEPKTDATEDATKTLETATKEEAVDNTAIRLMALQGPTGMGLASLLHNDKQGSGNEADYTAEIVTSAEISNIAASITKGECDIAAVPINLASTLFNKTEGKVQVLCANTLGVLHILENGDSVKSIQDLKGKTIYATGQGSTPEYVLRYVLKKNGIDPDKDVTITFVTDHTELATNLAANIYAIGMLPEPNVTVVLNQNKDFRVALNMTEEWNKVTDGKASLIQGVFIARKAFIDEHPTVVNAFLNDYNASQKLVNENPEQGANYIAECGIFANAAVAKKAIPGCNITFLEGNEMKSGVEKCLQILHEAAPASIGGKLPTEAFYYSR